MAISLIINTNFDLTINTVAMVGLVVANAMMLYGARGHGEMEAGGGGRNLRG